MSELEFRRNKFQTRNFIKKSLFCLIEKKRFLGDFGVEGTESLISVPVGGGVSVESDRSFLDCLLLIGIGTIRSLILRNESRDGLLSNNDDSVTDGDNDNKSGRHDRLIESGSSDSGKPEMVDGSPPLR